MNSEKNKKAAIYCRVSVFDKTKVEFSSVVEQEELLREFCRKKNWEVFNVYTDENKSGYTTERPEFEKLLIAAKNRQFDILLAYKIDRISRKANDWWKLIEEFEQNEIDIITLSPNLDPTTMEGKLFRGFLILFAEFEREQGKERTFLKRYSMAKEGCWLGGMPPIGYKLVNKELVVVEEQASLIREIFSLYLKKYPPSEISRILNNQGLKTPNKTAGTGRIYGNKKFNTNTILTYLKNPAYSGFVEHNNELFKGKHAAIISKEDWDAIQTSFNIKKESPRLGTGDTLLLTGILKCGECNSFMTTSASLKKQPDGSKKRYWYYRCTTKTRYGAEECKNRQISAPSIENYIIEYIAKIAENDIYAIKTKDKINFQRKIRAEKVAEILERKQGEKAALSKNINNITNAIAMTDDDSTIKYLIKNLDELTNQQKLLDGEISKRELILNGLQKNEATLEHLRIRLKEFSEIFYKLTQSDKRIIIKILIKEIVFSSPKESEKGRLKLRFWKKPDFEFEYDVNSGLRFEGSGSGGRT